MQGWVVCSTFTLRARTRRYQTCNFVFTCEQISCALLKSRRSNASWAAAMDSRWLLETSAVFSSFSGFATAFLFAAGSDSASWFDLLLVLEDIGALLVMIKRRECVVERQKGKESEFSSQLLRPRCFAEHQRDCPPFTFHFSTGIVTLHKFSLVDSPESGRTFSAIWGWGVSLLRISRTTEIYLCDNDTVQAKTIDSKRWNVERIDPLYLTLNNCTNWAVTFFPFSSSSSSLTE